MKRNLILILLISCSSLYSQRGVNQNLKGFDENRKVHFGFLLGLNQLNSNLTVNNSIFTDGIVTQDDTNKKATLKTELKLNTNFVDDPELMSLKGIVKLI